MTALIVISAKYLIAIPVIVALLYGFLVSDKRRYWAYAVAVLILSYGIALLARQAYYDPLPFVALQVQPLIAHEANNGFPSDHTLLAAAAAAIVTPFSLPLGILMWIIALAIGAARVLALVHHPIDIIGSLVIVAISALIAWPLAKRFTKVLV